MRRGTNFGGSAKKSMMMGKHKSVAFKAMQSQAFTDNSQNIALSVTNIS